MNKILINMSVIVAANLIAMNSFANSAETIKCKLPGCTLSCSSKDQPSKTYGPAKEVVVEVMSGGVIKYVLDKGIGGKQSVYVGPDSYMCSLNQP